jgi:hypothetical protein
MVALSPDTSASGIDIRAVPHIRSLSFRSIGEGNIEFCSYRYDASYYSRNFLAKLTHDLEECDIQCKTPRIYSMAVSQTTTWQPAIRRGRNMANSQLLDTSAIVFAWAEQHPKTQVPSATISVPSNWCWWLRHAVLASNEGPPGRTMGCSAGARVNKRPLANLT